MAEFFKTTSKNTVVFTGDGELIYYVPENYFTNGTATVIGDVVRLMGLFTYGLFDKSGKLLYTRLFKCPTTISCKPYKIDKVADYHLAGTGEAKPYRFLYFHKDDKLICSTFVPKEVDNVELFVKLLTGGHLPENIPYDQIQDFVIENANLNNFNYKVSNQVMGMVISELYRDKKVLSKPFRYTDMKDMTAYKAIRIQDGPKYTSPFTAVTSDNADEAIAAAMTVAGDKESPLEKIMMG